MGIVEAATSVIETYNAFITKIEELDLPCTVEARPILDVRLDPNQRVVSSDAV